jgi:uncharacterized membrane protein
MRIQFDRLKRIGRKLGLDEPKGFAIAVFLSLIIVIAVIAGLLAYSKFTTPTVGYNTIYLLDANHKAVDYPDVLVANQNSTFSVYVDVENHLGYSANYQVQIKFTNNISTFPVDTQPIQTLDMGGIDNGKLQEKTAVVTQNTPGNYSVVFELYQESNDGSLRFTQDYCVLYIQVIN